MGEDVVVLVLLLPDVDAVTPVVVAEGSIVTVEVTLTLGVVLTSLVDMGPLEVDEFIGSREVVEPVATVLVSVDGWVEG